MSSRKSIRILAGLALTVSAVPVLAAVIASEIVSSSYDRSALAITLYESDLAVVSERRLVKLPVGPSQVAFGDVAAQLQPQTVRLSGAGLRVIESRLAYDLLTPETLLKQQVGQEVSLIRTNPSNGEDHVEKGRLLSIAGGVPIFRVNGHIESGGAGSPWRIATDTLPSDLHDKPTLIASVESTRAGGQTLDLTYITGGISWSADYVAQYDDDNARLDLTAWASITNNSGGSFDNAKLRLVSGDLNRVASGQPKLMVMRAMAAEAAPMADGVSQSTAFEYYAYDFNRDISLGDHETKQLPLLETTSLKATREYRFDASQGIGWGYGQQGEQRGQAAVYIHFKNDIGRPLPRGTVRIYGAEGDAAGKGIVQLIGEDQLQQTPKGEDVELLTGRAFDLTARRTQLTQENAGENRYRASWRVVLHNAKSRDADVRVIEPMPGDWRIEKASQEYKRLDANRAAWTLKVPAGGETTLEYKVTWK